MQLLCFIIKITKEAFFITKEVFRNNWGGGRVVLGLNPGFTHQRQAVCHTAILPGLQHLFACACTCVFVCVCMCVHPWTCVLRCTWRAEGSVRLFWECPSLKLELVAESQQTGQWALRILLSLHPSAPVLRPQAHNPPCLAFYLDSWKPIVQ